MKTINKIIFGLVISVLVIFLGCKEEESQITKKKDFDSAEEYIENPSVNKAVEESNIPVYEGDNPPALAGDYTTEGEIIDGSSSINFLIGQEINSITTLYNQTASGRISFREKIGSLTVWGSGGYITGNSGRFTIWQESSQSGSDAGLPNDITINVALLMSGTKLENGDLDAKGISIITDVETDNSDYDVEAILGIWWMWEADFYLN